MRSVYVNMIKQTVLCMASFFLVKNLYAQHPLRSYGVPEINYSQKQLQSPPPQKTKKEKNNGSIGCAHNASPSFDVEPDTASLSMTIKEHRIQSRLSCYDPKELNYRRKYRIGSKDYFSAGNIIQPPYTNGGPVPMAMYATVGTNFTKGVVTNLGFLAKFYRKWDLMYNIEVNYSNATYSPIAPSEINFHRIGFDLGIGYAADFIEKRYIWGIGAILGGGIGMEIFNKISSDAIMIANPKYPLNQLKYAIYISGFSYLYFSNRWGVFMKTTLHVIPNSTFSIAEQNWTVGMLYRVISWHNYWKKYKD